MRLRLATLVAVATIATSTLTAHADTVYTYTGNDFNVVTAPYTTSDFLTGSFTVASPLGDNLAFGTVVDFTSFSFSDGVNLNITAASPGLSISSFEVATDAQGNISEWAIVIKGGKPFYQIGTGNQGPGHSQDNDYLQIGESAGTGVVEGDPGTWTAVTVDPPAATPEPSSFALLGTGILGLAGATRRRFLSRS